MKMHKAILQAFAEGVLVRPVSWRKQALRWDGRGTGGWTVFPAEWGKYANGPHLPRPEECLMPWVVVTEEQVIAEVGPSSVVPIASGVPDGRRNAYNEDVSREFRKPQLLEMYARMAQLAPSGALDEFTCGDPVPAFQFQLTLEPERSDRDRLVSVISAPEIDLVNCGFERSGGDSARRHAIARHRDS